MMRPVFMMVAMVVLTTSLSGCGVFRATKNFTYKVGEKFPTVGDSCKNTFFCFGDDDEEQEARREQQAATPPPPQQAPYFAPGRRAPMGNANAAQVPQPRSNNPNFDSQVKRPRLTPRPQSYDSYAQEFPTAIVSGSSIQPPPSPKNQQPKTASQRLRDWNPPPRPSAPPAANTQGAWQPPADFDPAGIRDTDEYRAVQQEVQGYAPSQGGGPEGPSADEIFNEIRSSQGLAPLPRGGTPNAGNTPAWEPVDNAPPPPPLPSQGGVPGAYEPSPWVNELPESPYNEIIRSVEQMPAP